MISVKIYTVAGGRTEAFSCGLNFNCPDQRDDFYQQNILDKRMESIAFSPEGCRYTLFKINGGRGDASEACVFIPKNTVTAQAPLLNVIECLRGVIDRGVTTETDRQTLEELCGKRCASMRNIVPSAGSSPAVLHYGGESNLSLRTILDDLFRPEYGGRRMVFLVDEANDVDYPDLPIIPHSRIYKRHCATFLPPSENKKHFRPYLDGDPFVNEETMFEGTPFTIEWRRDKWHPIVLPLIANDMLTEVDCQPRQEQYKRTKDNPLYFVIGICIAILLLATIAFVVYKVKTRPFIPKSNIVTMEHESGLFNQMTTFDFSNIFDDTLRAHNHVGWIEATQKLRRYSNTYGFSIPVHDNSIDSIDYLLFLHQVEAADYLATHEIWDKTEMEKIELLQGLFDYVNSYGFILERNKGKSWETQFKDRGIVGFDKLCQLEMISQLTPPFTRGNKLILQDYLQMFESPQREATHQPLPKSRTPEPAKSGQKEESVADKNTTDPRDPSNALNYGQMIPKLD